MNAVADYLSTTLDRFGQGWNRFWFQRSDPATLGVLRIAVGFAAAYWLLTYSFDLVRLFGPAGMLPVAGVDQWPASDFSVLKYVERPAGLWTIHVISLAAVFAFAAGFATRITSVLSLLVVLSYVWRAPMLTTEAEDVLTLLLVYLCLGPCGARFSIDAWLAAKRTAGGAATGNKSWAATISQRLIQVHVTAIYAVMVLAKLRGAVWWQGTAVWWLMAKSDSRPVDLTGWFANHPFAIDAWTHAIVLFEIAFAVLIWNRQARPLLLAVSVAMWMGLGLLTGNWLFCFLMGVSGLAFVPGNAWPSARQTGSQESARTANPAEPKARRSAVAGSF